MPDIVVAFFALGVVAGLARSDLKVPKAAYDTLSILLMLTIGFKGGLALHGNLHWRLLPELLAVAALGVLIPLLCYPVARKLLRLNSANSASLAAHYGSVSAGTFAVALAYAQSRQLEIAPQTTLYLVLLELPAIIVAIYLYKTLSGQDTGSKAAVWHEALTSRGVVLLTGGVLIGYFYGPEQAAPVSDLFITAFKGLLALFLLEMGLCTAKALTPVPWWRWPVMLFALLAPLVLAGIGMVAAWLLGLPQGSALILVALVASASYIAAPAAIAAAIKEADIGLAMLAALAVTFPFNVVVGIPLYARWVIGG
ncbi:sodium-dependent bicarbonate transport family permease [Zobellella endophytica]|uniref:Sodium-dependent bicarbonate transport family permease n=1 Tax=Zobellella endophytica TaxID=2116700 RepID=A0A2P7RB69_9GAMM|nr:sodium-dependent bicarbonate transport family permease [Zobellella endophytica]PSJ47484.1 sodium-dependent bicarbonate transport family permease [Zobellella endophytica]